MLFRNAVRSLAAILMVVWLLAIPKTGVADANSVNADTLMAVYTYNFAKFTEWPDSSFEHQSDPLNLCILGENSLGIAFNSIAGKKLKNRSLAVKHYPRVAVVRGCHIVFVSQSEKWRLSAILQDLHSLPILTVSDIEGFSHSGGMVTLFAQDHKIRFQINPIAVTGAGLKMSSKLLELAQIVHNSDR